MQVLGSSIYTKGGIKSSVSTKHNLFEETTYLTTFGAVANPAIYFGSFDEEAVVAGKRVENFASGATVGQVPITLRTSTQSG